jgi:hypothetical protein
MSEKKKIVMLQIPVSVELYAKITRIAEESIRKPRQQALYDLEQVYKNVKLNESDKKRFGIIQNVENRNTFTNGLIQSGVNHNQSADDEEEELL